MAVNIRNISEHLGLSYQTVANILSGSPKRRAKHTPDTQARVLEAAASLGYLPNRAARAVKTGRFGAIALLLSSDSNRSYLPPRLLDAILTELDDRALTLSVSRLPDRSENDLDRLPSYLRERACDGLLIDVTHRVARPLEQAIELSSLPSVWLNNRRRADSVFPDDRAAARIAVERLVAAGHRRIAYLQLQHGRHKRVTAQWHYSIFERQDGAERALRSAGLLTNDSMIDQAIAPVDRVGYVARLLRGEGRPTGVVTFSDAETTATVVAAGLLGLRLPRDLAIVSLSDDPQTVIGVEIETVMADRAALGVAAVRMLMEKIDRPGTVSSVAIAPKIVTGGSIAPPAGGG